MTSQRLVFSTARFTCHVFYLGWTNLLITGGMCKATPPLSPLLFFERRGRMYRGYPIYGRMRLVKKVQMKLNLTTRSAGLVSSLSFGSSAISLACITSMCSVQCFLGGHSLLLAFGSFFSPHPYPPPFIFPLLNQCDRCMVPLAWGLMAGGLVSGLPAMGA